MGETCEDLHFDIVVFAIAGLTAYDMVVILFNEVETIKKCEIEQREEKR